MPVEARDKFILDSTSLHSIGWTTSDAESNGLATTADDLLGRQGVVESRFRSSNWLIVGR